jgi:hypothetical protein
VWGRKGRPPPTVAAPLVGTSTNKAERKGRAPGKGGPSQGLSNLHLRPSAVLGERRYTRQVGHVGDVVEDLLQGPNNLHAFLDAHSSGRSFS